MVKSHFASACAYPGDYVFSCHLSSGSTMAEGHDGDKPSNGISQLPTGDSKKVSPGRGVACQNVKHQKTKFQQRNHCETARKVTLISSSTMCPPIWISSRFAVHQILWFLTCNCMDSLSSDFQCIRWGQTGTTTNQEHYFASFAIGKHRSTKIAAISWVTW